MNNIIGSIVYIEFDDDGHIKRLIGKGKARDFHD